VGGHVEHDQEVPSLEMVGGGGGGLGTKDQTGNVTQVLWGLSKVYGTGGGGIFHNNTSKETIWGGGGGEGGGGGRGGGVGGVLSSLVVVSPVTVYLGVDLYEPPIPALLPILGGLEGVSGQLKRGSLWGGGGGGKWG